MVNPETGLGLNVVIADSTLDCDSASKVRSICIFFVLHVTY